MGLVGRHAFCVAGKLHCTGSNLLLKRFSSELKQGAQYIHVALFSAEIGFNPIR